MKSSDPLKKIGGISLKSFCRFSEKGKHYRYTVVSLLLHDLSSARARARIDWEG